jgi:hypothetical protein
MKKILGLVLSGAILASPLASIAAAATAFDDSCEPVSGNDWNVEKNFSFSDQGKSYQLVFSRTNDGSGSICLVRGKSGKQVASKYWKSEFLDRVDRVSSKIFTFQVHQGNGNNSPTAKYRLNLTQPQNPQVTLMKKWIAN